MQCSHGAVALHTAEAAAAEVKSAKNVRQSVRPFTTPSDVTVSGTAHRSMRSSSLRQDQGWTGFHEHGDILACSEEFVAAGAEERPSCAGPKSKLVGSSALDWGGLSSERERATPGVVRVL